MTSKVSYKMLKFPLFVQHIIQVNLLNNVVLVSQDMWKDTITFHFYI